jgi:GNAT superfamily N-acetyltransferase
VLVIAAVDARLTTELRRSVLRPDWPRGTPMHGDDDPAALHLAAVEDGTAECACVLLPKPYPLCPEILPAWQLRGMATAEAARSRGLGGLVVEAAAAQLSGQGARLLWCEARHAAIPFYERHGFVAAGERFLHAETGIAHRLMARELSGAATSSDSVEVAGD